MQNHFYQVLFTASAGLFLLVVVVFLFLLAGRPGKINFLIKKSRYQDLVKAVKLHPLPPGERQSFWTDRRLNPSHLKKTPDKDRGNSTSIGLINAEWTKPDGYIIDFITVDNGHAGYAGYIYLDTPLPPGAKPPQPPHEPGHRFKRINKHWYAFHNNEG